MKKFLIGMLSAVLLVASVMGASSRKGKSGRTGREAGPALWV